MIAIIGAMDEEIKMISEKLSNVKKTMHSNIPFFEGELHNQKVILLKSGIGKVNAAVSTTILFENYEIDYVINIGTAGGVVESCNVLDVVISTEVVYHDVDVSAYDYAYGQVPNMPHFYTSNQDLVNEVEKVLISEGAPYHKGLIATGDAFIHNESQLMKITDQFPRCIAVEMEACAIAQVCHIYHKPFIILRSLSDIAGKESHISFSTYLEKASIHSSTYVIKLIEGMNE